MLGPLIGGALVPTMMALTNGNTKDPEGRFPEIALGTTLVELLSEEPDRDFTKSLCNIKPYADPRHNSVPLNKEFLMTSTQISDQDNLAHLQLEHASYLLSFCAGYMEHITRVGTDALPLLTAENAHIYPTSLILSDFLPGITNALNFFIRRDGSVKYIGSCHQPSIRAAAGGRKCTAFIWDGQDKLEQKFRDTLADIGEVPHNEGYFGPCGADIMETADGTQYVIDLNVRTTTSLILGRLKGHCQERMFNACTVYECLLLSVSRDALKRDFEEGWITLLGNTGLGGKDVWVCPVVLRGEDQDSVRDWGARAHKFEAGGKSDAQDAGGA